MEGDGVHTPLIRRNFQLFFQIKGEQGLKNLLVTTPGTRGGRGMDDALEHGENLSRNENMRTFLDRRRDGENEHAREGR